MKDGFIEGQILKVLINCLKKLEKHAAAALSAACRFFLQIFCIKGRGWRVFSKNLQNLRFLQFCVCVEIVPVPQAFPLMRYLKLHPRRKSLLETRAHFQRVFANFSTNLQKICRFLKISAEKCTPSVQKSADLCVFYAFKKA